MKKKRHSGPYVTNAERHTVPVLLRLDPEVAARLRALATERRCTLAEAVEQLLAGR